MSEELSQTLSPNKSAQKRGLGRGLAALIPSAKADLNTVEEIVNEAHQLSDHTQIIKIPLQHITLNQDQPRKYMNPEQLNDLSESILEHGILQPIVVRPHLISYDPDIRYQVIAGERRFRASHKAGLAEIPAIVRDIDDQTSMAIALIENIQREDLRTIEAAEGYQSLIRRFKMTQTDVARLVGKSQSHVANSLRMLALASEMQNSLNDGRISEGHAKVILSLETKEQQRLLWDRIICENLTVRLAEKMAHEIKSSAHQTPIKRGPYLKAEPDPYIVEVGRKIGDKIGTKVRLVPGKGDKGTIEISYFDKEHLEGLIERLAG